jgi:hypothetical protein
MSEELFETEGAEGTESELSVRGEAPADKSTVAPGHHVMADAAFSWGDLRPELGTVAPGHHVMADAAFSWGDIEA